jgi:hypothetical protein
MIFRKIEVKDKKWPKGSVCLICNLTVKIGDIALAARGAEQGTLAFHQPCMLRLAVETSPELQILVPNPDFIYHDAWSAIRDHIIATGGDPFGYAQQEEIHV